jgi:hypothetical protein
MHRRVGLLLIALSVLSATTVSLRTRTQGASGGTERQQTLVDYKLRPNRTVIVTCDMWDGHWCRGATERVNQLAKKMEPVVAQARRNGILIIHAPSNTMDFYALQPQRQSIQKPERSTPSASAISILRNCPSTTRTAAAIHLGTPHTKAGAGRILTSRSLLTI